MVSSGLLRFYLPGGHAFKGIKRTYGFSFRRNIIYWLWLCDRGLRTLWNPMENTFLPGSPICALLVQALGKPWREKFLGRFNGFFIKQVRRAFFCHGLYKRTGSCRALEGVGFSLIMVSQGAHFRHFHNRNNGFRLDDVNFIRIDFNPLFTCRGFTIFCR